MVNKVLYNVKVYTVIVKTLFNSLSTSLATISHEHLEYFYCPEVYCNSDHFCPFYHIKSRQSVFFGHIVVAGDTTRHYESICSFGRSSFQPSTRCRRPSEQVATTDENGLMCVLRPLASER